MQIKKKFYILIQLALLFIFQSLNTALSAEPLKVYVIAGQSNASHYGRTYNAPPTLQLDLSEISYSIWRRNRNSTPQISTTNGFIPMNFSRNPQIGIEASMAQTLIERDSNFAIIKVFQPGSNLHTDWDPSSDTDEEPSDENGWKLYQTLIDEVNLRLNDLREIHSEVSLEGLVWVQGESDRANDEQADFYGQRLTGLINAIRSNLKPNLKFYITELTFNTDLYEDERFDGDGVNDFQTLCSNNTQICSIYGAYTNKNHQWQTSVNDPNVELVHTSDLSFQDSVHYDTQSYIDIGQRVARKIILAENQTPSNVNRDELIQYYNSYSTSHLATNVLPSNKTFEETYAYQSVLGRLYTYNSFTTTTDNRVRLVSCSTEFTSNPERGNVPRINNCKFNEGEIETRLGWINLISSSTRVPLYRCYAPSITSTVLVRNASNCNDPNVTLLGYIEKNI